MNATTTNLQTLHRSYVLDIVNYLFDADRSYFDGMKTKEILQNFNNTELKKIAAYVAAH